MEASRKDTKSKSINLKKKERKRKYQGQTQIHVRRSKRETNKISKKFQCFKIILVNFLYNM